MFGTSSAMASITSKAKLNFSVFLKEIFTGVPFSSFSTSANRCHTRVRPFSAGNSCRAVPGIAFSGVSSGIGAPVGFRTIA